MKIIISEYTPKWINLYENEKEIILKACGSRAHSVRHIGSTSVPGLGAKPVIDILLGVTELKNAESFIPDMVNAGFEYISKYEDVMPERRYFVRRNPAGGSFTHVHTVEITSEFWRRHLMFRDYLRSHDDARDDYYNLKKTLAEKEWNDSNDYAGAKTEFVRKTEKEALDYLTEACEFAEAESMYDMQDIENKKTIDECGIDSFSHGNVKGVKTTNLPILLTNRLLGAGVNSAIDKSLLESVSGFYGDESSVYGFQIAPHLIGTKSENLLFENGFKNSSYWLKYYRDTSPAAETKTDLNIREIGNDERKLFSGVAGTVYELPEMIFPLFEEVVGKKNWRHFMAFDGSKPAATGAMYINGDTAWCGLAATMKESRGKGAQGALLAARINAAREAGCKWLTIETGPDTPEQPNPSYRNILRHGFVILYQRLNYVKRKTE